MPPIPFAIERKELERMKELQTRRHREWPAAFSTNSARSIWLYTHSGNTPLDKREFVDGMFEFIEGIAETYRYERPGGGRFFVSERVVSTTRKECRRFNSLNFYFWINHHAGPNESLPGVRSLATFTAADRLRFTAGPV